MLEGPELKLPPIPTTAELRRAVGDFMAALDYPSEIAVATPPLVAGLVLLPGDSTALDGFDLQLDESFVGAEVAGVPIKARTGFFSEVYDRGLVGVVQYRAVHRVHSRLWLKIRVYVAQRSALDLHRRFLDDYVLRNATPLSVKRVFGAALGDVSAVYGPPDSSRSGGIQILKLEFLRHNVRVQIHSVLQALGGDGVEPDLNPVVLGLARDLDTKIQAEPRYQDLQASGKLPTIEQATLPVEGPQVPAGTAIEYPVQVRGRAPDGDPFEIHLDLLGADRDGTRSKGEVEFDTGSGGWVYYPGELGGAHLLVIHLVSKRGLVATKTFSAHPQPQRQGPPSGPPDGAGG